MDNHKHLFPIGKMSKVFEVSRRSGYYRWRDRPPSDREVDNTRFKTPYKKDLDKLSQDLRKSAYSSATAGRRRAAQPAPRGPADEAAGDCQRDSPQVGDYYGFFHSLPAAPNVLKRNFRAASLAEKWVGDITYLPGRDGWLYLTTVMDLADRQIIGWSLAGSMKANQTTIPAFQVACQRRPPSEGLIFHSDRGVQYAAAGFTKRLDARKVTQSMSRKGNCWDNAPAESFLKPSKPRSRSIQGPVTTSRHARLCLTTSKSGITGNVCIRIWITKLQPKSNNFLTQQPKTAQHA